MKKTQGKRRIKKELVIFLLLLLINASMMLIDDKGKGLSGFKSAGFSFFSVFQKGFAYTINFFIETGNSIGELREMRIEYQNLLEKATDFESMENDFIELKRKNLELKKLLSLMDDVEFEKIPALIIGNDPGSFYNTIVINKGTKHGIEEGMSVVAFHDGFQGLVGRITETGAISSKILPLYDKKFFAAGRLQNLRYEGLVHGNYDGRYQVLMNYVNKSARDRIGYGDIIVTSGMGSIYPRGIYIGRVRSVVVREYETSLELEIEPVVDFSRLEYVFVLKEERVGDEE